MSTTDTTPRAAIAGKTVHWFVVHSNGQPQLLTAGISRRLAIKYWLRVAKEDWPYWYRRGMRAKRVEIKWREYL